MKKNKFYSEYAYYYDFICTDRKKDVAILNKLIKKYKKSKGDKLLDVGCGTGLEDKYLKRDYQVTGIDLHQGVRDFAQKRNPEINYIIGDMRYFRLNEKFDIITCFDAMCHLQNYRDLKAALKNFYNHLNKSGILIFYIDEQFLKEHYKEDKIVINQKTKGPSKVILIEIYHKKSNRIEGNVVYWIKEKGKTRIEVLPTDYLGFFEVRKIKQILNKLDFKTYLYSTDSEITFSTRNYTKKGLSPVFVCIK